MTDSCDMVISARLEVTYEPGRNTSVRYSGANNIALAIKAISAAPSSLGEGVVLVATEIRATHGLSRFDDRIGGAVFTPTTQ